MAADFDGDGTGDIAVFRASASLWSVRNVTRFYFGSAGDAGIAGDFDGSGTDRAAIFRQGIGLWSVRDLTRTYLGSGGDLPKIGDYDGDGTEDFGIFRPSAGLWVANGITRIYFGSSIDQAIEPGKAAHQCRLPVTGQDLIYRVGDDGWHKAGAAFNFHTEVIAGAMITIDHNTGLMWASDGSQFGCNWGQQTSWNAAIDWCHNLNFAGYSDWRLANYKELISIVDRSHTFPAVDPSYFPNTDGSIHYWSSTSVNGSEAVTLSFMGGMTGDYAKSSVLLLRAVRGGE